MMRDVLQECSNLRDSLQVLNDESNGPLLKSDRKNTQYPFVLLLGNHSSGKSSFVNYVLQRNVQTTGVAPTDDCFTIIGAGEEDANRAGPALVGDPDLGFAGLQSFGPSLVHQTKLKIRKDIATSAFMIVDTPGMIDSPVVPDRPNNGLALETAPQDGPKDNMDRGYDFEKVCRWYAERADVILLFFDPDKPGTTGETLNILTNSLDGFDHKLLIILNKADQFRKIHDFARAYGSLCWNLSKVINRKDLPQIYTMCLPSKSIHLQCTDSGGNAPDEPRDACKKVELVNDSLPQLSSGPANVLDNSSLGEGLKDLALSRDEVLAEVFQAPKRRVDNEISRLSTAIETLTMHCKISNSLLAQASEAVWSFRRGVLSAVGVASAAAMSGGFGAYCFIDMVFDHGHIEKLLDRVRIGSVLSGSLLVGWLCMHEVRMWDMTVRNLASTAHAQHTFEMIYARELAFKDKHILSLWSTVFRYYVLNNGVLNNSNTSVNDTSSSGTMVKWKVTNDDKFSYLGNMLQYEVARLRRKASVASQQSGTSYTPAPLTAGSDSQQKCPPISSIGTRAAMRPQVPLKRNDDTHGHSE